jgi:hypothetical protein
MVIHDRSSRTESGEFCGWKIVGRSGFSTAPPAKAGAASVEMTILSIAGKRQTRISLQDCLREHLGVAGV